MPAQKLPGDQVVFNTKWFEIISRPAAGPGEPHYLIHSTDIVVIVARDEARRLLLVRQFRPSNGVTTLEIPSGHVEIGETEEEAARKELLEETGHVAGKLELLRSLSPGIGRFTNRMTCYFAAGAHPTSDPKYLHEAGVEPVFYQGTIRALLAEPDFCSSLSHTAVAAALAADRLNLD